MTVAELPAPAIVAVQRVLAELEHVVPMPSGDLWRAHCPVVHRDREGAVSVRLNKPRTRIHVSCAEGCTESAVRSAIGLPVSAYYVLDADLLARENEMPMSEREPGDTRLPGATCALFAPPVEPIQFAIEDLWTAGEIGLVVGDGGSFKSTAALAMAAAMAGGYPVWGHFQCAQRAALILSAEDAGNIVQMRLESLVAGHGWDRDRVLGNVHYIATPDVTLGDPAWQQHVLNEAQRIDAGIVVLDPLADLLDGDESSNTDVRPLLKLARKIAQATGAAVPIVHHAGKMKEGGRDIDRIRGASALNAAARSILFFDYHDTGVTVQHLKMSRAPKLDTFVLLRSITADPQNRAQWLSANLTYSSAADALLTKPEQFVMTQVGQSPGLTTRALKSAATGIPGLNGENVQDAITTLQSRGRIASRDGPNRSKGWYVKSGKPSVPSVPAHQNGAVGGRGVLDLSTNYRADPLRGSATRGREEEQQRSRSGEKAPNGVAPRLHRDLSEIASDDEPRWPA